MARILAAIVALAIAAGLPTLPGCVKSPSAEVRDTWEVYFLQGQRIGYGHTTVRREVQSGQQIVRTESLNRLAVQRAGQTTREEIRSTSVETPQGKLIRFESELAMGQTPMHTTGRVEGDRLVLETGAGATLAQTSISWPSDCLGPFATEQTLTRRPMQPGERRTLKVFLIGFNQVADLEMIAKVYEPAALRSGSYDLLRIETVTRLADGQKIQSTLWTDRAGEILKTSQAMGLETYRASKAEALEKADLAELDLLAGTKIKVGRPLPHAHQTKRVRYRVRLEGGDPAGAFVAGPSQAVKSIDAHTAEIAVYAIRPAAADGNRDALADPPGDDDRRPNSFIQSDDPTILADAQAAAGDETDPWRVAVALERYVNRAVKEKNFAQAFATAAEVARSRQGDCTEHAVFLAALCRARGIPARIAVGLVYMEGQQAFGYHAWTEAYIDKRWVPIDGTLAAGGIGAGHLTIAHSNLEGASAYSAFLPVAQVLGRLSIEIVDIL